MNLREKGRVLIVEHNPSILRSHSHRLSQAGFKVSQASEATDALRHVEDNDFDLLISDFKLPQMDGLTLLRRVREHSSSVQFVLVLEAANNQIAVRAAELGVFQSLVKPIRLDILERTATLAMQLHRERKSPWNQTFRPAHRTRETSITATEAKNEFGRVLEKAIRGSIVVITKHDAPKAVLISMDEFKTLSNIPELKINALSAEFDSLLTRMQGPVARASMEAAFHASPQELGRAALAAARKRG